MHVLRQDRLRHLQDVRLLSCSTLGPTDTPLIPVSLVVHAHRDTKNRVGRLQCKDCNQSFQVRFPLQAPQPRSSPQARRPDLRSLFSPFRRRTSTVSKSLLSAGEQVFFQSAKTRSRPSPHWSADLSEPVDVYSAWIDACELQPFHSAFHERPLADRTGLTMICLRTGEEANPVAAPAAGGSSSSGKRQHGGNGGEGGRNAAPKPKKRRVADDEDEDEDEDDEADFDPDRAAAAGRNDEDSGSELEDLRTSKQQQNKKRRTAVDDDEEEEEEQGQGQGAGGVNDEEEEEEEAVASNAGSDPGDSD